MALEDKARGQRIAGLRKRKHFTQQAMAEALKIAYRTYQTWEAGTMPEWDNLEKLALFHGVKPEEIVGEVPALVVDEGQLDRIEAQVAATRVEIGALSTQLTDLQRTLAQLSKTGAVKSRTRKAK